MACMSWRSVRIWAIPCSKASARRCWAASLMAMKNLTINAPRRLSAALAVALLGLTQTGLAHAPCQGMVLHAHRGSPDAPENALSAIKQAVVGPWDGAETDIQQLRDGYWVIHHDAQVGRTLSLQG